MVDGVGTYNGNGGGEKTVKFSGLDDITRRDLISDYKGDSYPQCVTVPLN